jgi:carbon monoxide dehydrogenase subunit G
MASASGPAARAARLRRLHQGETNMEISGQQHIAAPREAVWRALNDPDVLRQCIPGCQSLDRDGPERFKANVEIKIGPIGARFAGAVTLTDLDPPSGYTLVGEGNGGMAGSARGAAKVTLLADGDATILNYVVDAQVGGRLAQLGGPIIEATAKQLSAKFFATFNALLVGVAAPEVARPGTAGAPLAARAPVHASAFSGRIGGLPAAWILAVVVAAMTGFLVGRGGGGTGSDWMGLAVGLLVVIVAAAGFEFGRRSAAPVVVLDEILLSRILGSGRR